MHSDPRPEFWEQARNRELARQRARRDQERAAWESAGRPHCTEYGPCAAHAAAAETIVAIELEKHGQAPTYRGDDIVAWWYEYRNWERWKWSIYHGVYLRETNRFRAECEP